MKKIKGKYNEAVVYTENIEESAILQVKELCDQEAFKGSKIKIMPDVHAGAGCVIGFTADLGPKVIPNIVGVDIGCGMLTVALGNARFDLKEIDDYINENIPNGFNNNQEEQDMSVELRMSIIETCDRLGLSSLRQRLAVGSLGGGNHFIEISKDSKGNAYLIIHTGSRNFGFKVAKHYQNEAVKYIKTLTTCMANMKNKEIGLLRQSGMADKINEMITVFGNALNELKLPKALCYLEGELMENYLKDMKTCQLFAEESRESIARRILESQGISFDELNSFHTVHNYISFDDNIIRKGAISANKGEKVLIPMNMRDGSLLCEGLGNNEWNNSAPHGAGRLMSRTQAKEKLNVSEFEKEMSDIFTTSVMDSTLDEAPMAYKPMQEIIDNTRETVKVMEILKPIYNFKAH